MGDVVPFQPKEKPPSKGEMDAWRMLTKGWADEVKQLITPRYWKWAQRGL